MSSPECAKAQTYRDVCLRILNRLTDEQLAELVGSPLLPIVTCELRFAAEDLTKAAGAAGIHPRDTTSNGNGREPMWA